MRLRGRQRQIYQALEARGPVGLTVIEAMQLGLGTELRRVVTSLIRKGYKINKTWEKKTGRKYIRYTLESEPPKMATIIDNLTGEKSEVMI